MKHMRDIRRFVEAGDYRETDEGLLIHGGLIARGVYSFGSHPDEHNLVYNLVPTEGLNYILSAGLLRGTQELNWYLAIFSGTVNPVATWTAANFAVTATEITSTTEGYTNPTRPLWVPAGVSSGAADSFGSRAVYNIKCTSQLNISGAALLSSDVRGGTDGVLASATRFQQVQTYSDGAEFYLGYKVELLDS